MIDILTIEEVRRAMRVDADYDSSEVNYYKKLSTSFVFNKTGYSVKESEEPSPLAKELASNYITTKFYSGDNYNKDYDYTLGINGLIQDLQGVVRENGTKS